MINEIKWFFQRLIRGYADCDIWSLDVFIVEKIRKPLKAFIRHQEEEGMSLPAEFGDNPTAWLLTLSKIEYAFDQVWMREKNLSDEVMSHGEQVENEKKIAEGFELFGRFFQHLWD
jgi:hypothetical protein